MQNNPVTIVNNLIISFGKKYRVYLFIYYFLNILLLLTSATLSIIASLVSVNIIKSIENYALISLIIGAFVSFFTSILSFFVIKKRYYRHKGLYTYILLEKDSYDLKFGEYSEVNEPEFLLLDRVYNKLGLEAELQEIVDLSLLQNDQGDL